MAAAAVVAALAVQGIELPVTAILVPAGAEMARAEPTPREKKMGAGRELKAATLLLVGAEREATCDQRTKAAETRVVPRPVPTRGRGLGVMRVVKTRLLTDASAIQGADVKAGAPQRTVDRASSVQPNRRPSLTMTFRARDSRLRAGGRGRLCHPSAAEPGRVQRGGVLRVRSRQKQTVAVLRREEGQLIAPLLPRHPPPRPLVTPRLG